MDFVLSILEQGLIYGILALGVYITYKILDFPDLTVDGSFPLGSAVTAALLTRDVNPYLSLFAAFLAGVLAGTCTGLIHVKGKVRDLLSGIIMMTALYTVNLMIAGSNNVPLFAQDTIFSNSFLEGVTGGCHGGKYSRICSDPSDSSGVSGQQAAAGLLSEDQIRIPFKSSGR